MIVTKIVRGNVVEFTATFLDEDGAEVDPASVDVLVSYINSDGNRVSTTIDMDDQSSGEYTATWNSSGAKKGRVHWAVRATTPAAAEEGFFDLSANLANPDP